MFFESTLILTFLILVCAGLAILLSSVIKVGDPWIMAFEIAEAFAKDRYKTEVVTGKELFTNMRSAQLIRRLNNRKRNNKPKKSKR